MNTKLYRAWNPSSERMSEPFSIEFLISHFNSEHDFNNNQDHFLYTNDDLEIMQCIGWEDRDKNLLFEMDIVKYTSIHFETVIGLIKNEGFSYELWNVAQEDWEVEILREFQIDQSQQLDLIRIGNFYETPHFLDKNLKFI